jgi:parallel beta-helix repeat protein
VIRNNVVADAIGYSSMFEKPLFCAWGIYLDSFAGGYTVTDNIVYRTTYGGMMFQGGKDNRVENNIFVDGTLNQVHINNFSNNSTGLVFQRNIVAYREPTARLFSAGRLSEDMIRIDRNVYGLPGKEPSLRASGIAGWAGWLKAGFDGNSLLADPRFVDPAHDNYALRPDSPALKLGFQPIDTSQVGPRRRRCPCHIRPAGPDFGL